MEKEKQVVTQRSEQKVQLQNGDKEEFKMKNQPNNYYISRKLKLLKSFDKTASLVRDSVVSGYGSDFADTLYTEVRQVYEELIPEMPYDDDAMNRTFLTITTQELAVYKVMKKYGKTAGEAWEICHDALRMRMKKFPKVVRWFAKQIWFSNLVKNKTRKENIAKMQKEPSADYLMKFVEGDGKNFDFGADWVACGNLKFVQDQGAEEFAPYACMSDIALSDAWGWGLIRTETLADGCERCDFRFKKGGKTRISSRTPEVQATIEKIAGREAAG